MIPCGSTNGGTDNGTPAYPELLIQSLLPFCLLQNGWHHQQSLLMMLRVTSPLSSYAFPSGSYGGESLWLCSVLGCPECPQGTEPGSVLTMWGSEAFLRAPPNSVWATHTWLCTKTFPNTLEGRITWDVLLFLPHLFRNSSPGKPCGPLVLHVMFRTVSNLHLEVAMATKWSRNSWHKQEFLTLSLWENIFGKPTLNSHISL